MTESRLSLTDRQRQIAAKCIVLAVDFSVEEHAEGNILIVEDDHIRLHIVHTGKICHVDILGKPIPFTGNLPEGEDEPAAEGIRLSQGALIALWRSLTMFSDLSFADKAAAEAISKFMSVLVMKEGEQVLSVDASLGLIGRQKDRAQQHPKRFSGKGREPGKKRQKKHKAGKQKHVPAHSGVKQDKPKAPVKKVDTKPEVPTEAAPEAPASKTE